MEYVIGIDIGGTSIKAGLFTPKGEFLEERKIPTLALVNADAYATVTTGIEQILSSYGASNDDVIACGLDIPGPVSADGTVGFLANIELDPDGLVHAISSEFSRANIAFVNDGNAAALGEMWAGSAQGVGNFCLIALGTGVGAGMVCNGNLVAGAFGSAGEIGHITVNLDEELECGCGRRGCLEQYASAKGVVRLYLEECARRGVTPAPVEHATDTLTVFRALANGDDCARRSVEEMCDYLALAMSQVSCVVDPEMFLIGGGVAGSFATFAPTLRELYQKYALPSCRKVRIEAAVLGNRAAMYGCAYEALRTRRA